VYVLPFRFKNARSRTSHYLNFVSKHFKGYEIMKDIMARKNSSAAHQGVLSFEYDPTGGAKPFSFDLSDRWTTRIEHNQAPGAAREYRVVCIFVPLPDLPQGASGPQTIFLLFRPNVPRARFRRAGEHRRAAPLSPCVFGPTRSPCSTK